MMDCILEPGIEEFVYYTSTQVGKSECELNLIGYFINLEPSPIMNVLQTTRGAKDFSKRRLQQMIEHCPALRGKVRERKSRAPGNEILMKEFPGGYITIVPATSGNNLRQYPIAKLLFDEVDGYPSLIPGEGDPIDIARRRTDAFPRQRLIGYIGTPSKPKGFSRIEGAWLRSDQRRFLVPCPYCEFRQALHWGNKEQGYRLRWERDEATKQVLKQSVCYLCENCSRGIQEYRKWAMLEAGQWVKQRPDVKSIAGFRLNALYSPWAPIWARMAQEFMEAAHEREKLRTFVNLSLGETFEESPDATLEPYVLRQRTEVYETPKWKDGEAQPIVSGYLEQRLLPPGVCLLTVGTDMQVSRLEAQLLGWGPGPECWVLDYQIFYGNPGETGEVWQELDAWLLRPWKHPAGVELTPAVTFIDMGYNSDAVYKFVAPRQNIQRRVYACKGVDRLPRPGLAAESTTKKHAIRLFLVSTYSAKDQIFSALAVERPKEWKPGQRIPGYVHFPDWVTDDYFGQLLSERRVPQFNRYKRITGFEWVKTQERNEVLDTMVYNVGALWALQQVILPGVYGDLERCLQLVQAGKAPSLPYTRPRILDPGL